MTDPIANARAKLQAAIDTQQLQIDQASDRISALMAETNRRVEIIAALQLALDDLPKAPIVEISPEPPKGGLRPTADGALKMRAKRGEIEGKILAALERRIEADGSDGHISAEALCMIVERPDTAVRPVLRRLLAAGKIEEERGRMAGQVPRYRISRSAAAKVAMAMEKAIGETA